MSAHALAQGGLRPAEALPPTLIPNAIRSAAPHTDRAKSFLASCLIYGCGASAVIFLARNPQLVKPKVPITVTIPLIETIVPPAPQVVALPPVAPPSFLRTEPRDTTTPVDPNVVPETPDHTDLTDRSHEIPAGIESPGLKVVGRSEEVQPPHVIVDAFPPPILDVPFSSLRVLHQVAPTYPAMARIARIQGAVTLLMTIDAKGVPIDVKVISTPNPCLNAESIRVAQQWRFEPAMQDGKPMAAQFQLTLNYRLSN